jgi:hypothetical protein
MLVHLRASIVSRHLSKQFSVNTLGSIDYTVARTRVERHLPIHSVHFPRVARRDLGRAVQLRWLQHRWPCRGSGVARTRVAAGAATLRLHIERPWRSRTRHGAAHVLRASLGNPLQKPEIGLVPDFRKLAARHGLAHGAAGLV